MGKEKAKLAEKIWWMLQDMYLAISMQAHTIIKYKEASKAEGLQYRGRKGGGKRIYLSEGCRWIPHVLVIVNGKTMLSRSCFQELELISTFAELFAAQYHFITFLMCILAKINISVQKIHHCVELSTKKKKKKNKVRSSYTLSIQAKDLKHS